MHSPRKHTSSQTELRRIHKTVLSFLKSYNFTHTSSTFVKELKQNGFDEIENIEGKTLVLRPCKCSKNAEIQTEFEQFARYHRQIENEIIGDTESVAIDDTLCIEVCDDNCKTCSAENIQQKCECSECFHHGQKINGVVEQNCYKNPGTPTARHRDSYENISKENKTTVLYSSSQKNLNENKSNVQNEQNDDLLKLRSQFSILQEEHQKLISVTSELTSALQLNITGQTQNIYRVLDQCKIIYPTLFVQQSELESKIVDYMENPSNEIDDKCECNIQNDNSDEKIYEEAISPLNLHNTPEDSATNQTVAEENKSRCITPDMIQGLLENVLKNVLDKSSRMSSNTSKKSIDMSGEDIQKMVEEALTKAMESPRLNTTIIEPQISSSIQQKVELVQPTTPTRNIITENRPMNKTNNIICRPASPYRNVEYFELDFNKLKTHLTNAENEKKLRILQALRWRITKTNVTEQRNKTMESYVENDLLNLSRKNSFPEQFFKDCSISYIQEAVSRLINTMASLKYGRDYLSSDDRLLKSVLIPAIKDIRHICSPVTKDMLTATLQKLSLRKILRLKMVKEGLLEELVNYLNERYKSLSKYSLEFCSALVMNLCLVSEAKERASKISKQIVMLLKSFLESGNNFCLPYINGIMFSLLENEQIRLEAKSQNVDELVLHVMKQTTNENMRKQLDYILQSRLIGKVDLNEENNDDNDERQEEVDLLEGELDEGDFLTNLSSGEELLAEFRLRNSTTHRNISNNNSRKCFTANTSPQRKCPPNSSRSYTGEYHQMHRRSTLDTKVYESGSSNSRKPIRINAQRQHKSMKNVKKAQPMVSTCYLENCRKIQEGDTRCRCSKCVPGLNKYSCSCYENMRKEIVEDGLISDFIQENASSDSSGNTCPVCKEKKCECAFDSRPKINRTPPVLMSVT